MLTTVTYMTIIQHPAQSQENYSAAKELISLQILHRMLHADSTYF